MDGALGTELIARGVCLSGAAWSAAAIDHAAQTLASIHADYAKAGATLHTANTFRTQPGVLGGSWRGALEGAIRIARAALPPGNKLLGSVAPVEDCYRPDLSPGVKARTSHRIVAQALAEAGCDVLLCETFPAEEEALTAVEEAVATGLPVWIAMTAGPQADLLTPRDLAQAASRAVGLGAQRALVNCVAVSKAQPYVDELARLGVPFGAYANAGSKEEGLGWEQTTQDSAARYAELVRGWVEAGATVVGGCCGTRPAHIEALSRRFAEPVSSRSS